MDASTCPGMDSDCATRTCVGGKCGVDFKPLGSALATQAPNDCQTAVCDGNGGHATQPDATDIVDDGNPCTDELCSGTMPTHPSSMSGKACAVGTGKLCDGAGACVECLANSDCTSNICQMHKCIAAGCLDTTKNGTETDVDCGGPVCNACNDLLHCGVASDCKSQVCTGMVCQHPTCTDGVKNGTETAVDCGGACPACPTCTDGIKNQGETGIDCGGPCGACPTCNDGMKNGTETGVDCGGTCPACPTCTDGVQNQGETGVDCGGPCGACPTCNDGMKNGMETGVDCGGPVCPACPSCNDGIKNQGETGIDCGGPCPACGTCNDGVMNQGETGVDCGGPCPACPTCNEAWLCTPWDTGTGTPATSNAGTRSCIDTNMCNTTINKPATTATLPVLDLNYFECNVEPILDRKCGQLGCHGSENYRALRVYSRARLREATSSIVNAALCMGSATGSACTGSDSCPCNGKHVAKEWQRNFDSARGFALDSFGVPLASESNSDLLLQAKVGGKSHGGIHLFATNDAEYTTILNWLNGATLATCNPGGGNN
jgi:hypothetical protein